MLQMLAAKLTGACTQAFILLEKGRQKKELVYYNKK